MYAALWSAGQYGPWLRTVWHVLLEQKLTQSPSGQPHEPEIGQQAHLRRLWTSTLTSTTAVVYDTGHTGHVQIMCGVQCNVGDNKMLTL